MRASGGRIASLLVAAGVVALVTGCAGGQPASPSAASGPLNVSQLKIRLIEQLGPLWYCDPDFYPVSRATEPQLAQARFPEMQADTEAFAAIAAHVGATPGDSFTADQKTTLYQLWKQVHAIVLTPDDEGDYDFVYVNHPAPGASEGRRTTGTINADGTIDVESQAPAGAPACPICLARGTRIATPAGEVPVEDVVAGTRVWSVDGAGKRFVATVLRVGQTPVPATHEVVRLVLADGRVVRASPGHPLPDGRVLGDLRAGDVVDGAPVASAVLEPYDGGFTFDLLPSGPTGVYIADGVPLGSTLAGR
jgi:hypothetical protein